MNSGQHHELGYTRTLALLRYTGTAHEGRVTGHRTTRPCATHCCTRSRYGRVAGCVCIDLSLETAMLLWALRRARLLHSSAERGPGRRSPSDFRICVTGRPVKGGFHVISPFLRRTESGRNKGIVWRGCIWHRRKPDPHFPGIAFDVRTSITDLQG